MMGFIEEPDETVTVHPRPIHFLIVGDEDLDTHVHFQIQIDDADDFSDPVVDVESKTTQTNWYYSDGSAWQSVPIAGVSSYKQYVQDLYGQQILTDKGNAGYSARYDVQSGLLAATLYYVRIRHWDIEGNVYGDWKLLAPFIL